MLIRRGAVNRKKYGLGFYTNKPINGHKGGHGRLVPDYLVF